MPTAIYAEVSDLACTVLDKDVAQKLIERASYKVTQACRHLDSIDLDVARIVVCQMVERALASPTAEDFGQSPQTMQSVSQYSNTWTWGNPVGHLFMYKDEYAMLGVGASATFAPPSYGRLDGCDG